MNIYEVLEELKIKYEEFKHPAAYTVEDMKKITDRIDGTGCKNLFLTDKKERYFMYLLHEDKRADIKELSHFLGCHLSFGSEDDLKRLLNLEKGSVTPFGIINDSNCKVVILIDNGLVDKKLLFHPNVNTASISIEYYDLLRFIEYEKHTYKII